MRRMVKGRRKEGRKKGGKEKEKEKEGMGLWMEL
jgi:hypothetical protein